MKARHHFKGLVIGLLVGILISSSVMIATASNGAITLENVINGINITINGEAFTPKDANGKAVDVFLYNGTTYVPIRAIGQAFDKEFEWDGATRTVKITNKQAGVCGNCANGTAHACPECGTALAINTDKSAPDYNWKCPGCNLYFVFGASDPYCKALGDPANYKW